MKTWAKYRFLLPAMFEKLMTSNPVWPPPPVAIVRTTEEGYTVDGEEDGECNATAHGKHHHHHSEISKEEVSILSLEGSLHCVPIRNDQ